MYLDFESVFSCLNQFVRLQKRAAKKNLGSEERKTISGFQKIEVGLLKAQVERWPESEMKKTTLEKIVAIEKKIGA